MEKLASTPSARGTTSPNPLLALVCAAIVQSYNPRWLSGSVASFAREEQVSPSRVSRLKSALQGAFDGLLRRASTRGRPQRPAAPDTGQAEADAFLQMLARSLESRPAPRRDLQDWLVSIQAQIKDRYGLTQEAFCEALDIPVRTFRSWKARGPRPIRKPRPTPDPGKKTRRPRETGAFDLEEMVAGTQLMGDTTDWELFGVGLKVIAVQDPGNRDRNIWEAFDVASCENSKEIVRIVKAAAEQGEYLQFLCDQGRPYVAKATQEALESLPIEFSPQKEYTATAKATLERSFGVVKPILAPLVEWSRKLVERVPDLRNGVLARTIGRLVLTAVIKAHSVGLQSRVVRTEAPDPAQIRDVIDERIEGGRADERSKRLFLEKIHTEYRMEGSREAFVRSLRRYALEDIKEAERRLRDRACKCGVSRCERYFVGILRNVVEVERPRRRAERRKRLDRRAQDREIRLYLEAQKELDKTPDALIARGLRFLVQQWDEGRQELLFGGVGPGRSDVRRGLRLLHEAAGPLLFVGAADSIWQAWLRDRPSISAAGLAAIRTLWEILVSEQEKSLGGLPHPPRDRILHRRPALMNAASPLRAVAELTGRSSG